MNIKTQLSLLVIALIGLLPLQANAVAEVETAASDSVIVSDTTKHYNIFSEPASSKRKLKSSYRPVRIDREITKMTFIPKGTWMTGGTASYSEHDEDNLNFLVLKDVKALGYTFSISPYVGYFFKDNVAAGMRFAYNRTYLDMDNFELNLGEDFNINLNNLYWLEHKYEVSGFLRTYMPIGKSKIFGLFNELRLTYGYGEGKNSTGSGTEYDGTYERSHNFLIGMAPGLTAFITDWSAVEVSVGVMGYNFKWVNQTTNQIETGKKKNFIWRLQD